MLYQPVVNASHRLVAGKTVHGVLARRVHAQLYLLGSFDESVVDEELLVAADVDRFAAHGLPPSY